MSEKLSRDEAVRGMLAIFGAIMKMSDDAEKLGGATSLAGVASLHKMQKSLQKNAVRMARIAEILLAPTLHPTQQPPHAGETL